MGAEFRFVCPACGEAVIVDRAVRDEMLAEGCVVCSSQVTANCFESV